MKKPIYLLATAVLFLVLAGGIIFAVLLRASLLGDSWGTGSLPRPTASKVAAGQSAPESGSGRLPSEPSAAEKAPAGQKNPVKAAGSPNASRMTAIVLEGNTASISGSGADVYNGAVTIHESGTYYISGTLEKGQIIVNTRDEGTVTLCLNGVHIFHPSEAALQVTHADHTLLRLEEGTINRLQSGVQCDIVPAGEEDVSGAALYARNDLTIAGEGALQVLGYLNNGIQATGRLSVESGKVDVVAVNHALKGNEAVAVEKGEFSLLSGGDGIQAGASSGEGQGTVSISTGSFIIKSGGDGIQAESLLDIAGGVFTINSGVNSDAAAPESAKGMTSAGDLRFADCSITIESPEDSLYAGSALRIISGSFVLSSQEDALRAGTDLVITDGTIQIPRSHAGMEGRQIAIHGGEISIVSEDQGINASGSRQNGELPSLRILDGIISISSGGNGIDSDGNLSIKGGNIVIDGPEEEDGQALNFRAENGGSCEITGGLLLLADHSDLRITSRFSHSFLRRRFSSPIAAGSEITVSTRTGEVLSRLTLAKPASSVLFSSSELVPWHTYLITADGQKAQVAPEKAKTSGGTPWWKWWER